MQTIINIYLFSLLFLDLVDESNRVISVCNMARFNVMLFPLISPILRTEKGWNFRMKFNAEN